MEGAASGVKSQVSMNESDDISNQYDTPTPEPVTSFTALKARIRHHYELASDYYLSLW